MRFLIAAVAEWRNHSDSDRRVVEVCESADTADKLNIATVQAELEQRFASDVKRCKRECLATGLPTFAEVKLSFVPAVTFEGKEDPCDFLNEIDENDVVFDDDGRKYYMTIEAISGEELINTLYHDKWDAWDSGFMAEYFPDAKKGDESYGT